MTGSHGRAVLFVVIQPTTFDDAQRLAEGLARLAAEDPTLVVQADQLACEVIVGGRGELHLEIVLDRLKREFNVEASVGRPTVAYMEVLTRPADGEMKYMSHTGGRAHYAHVKLRCIPTPPGTGYVFVNGISGGSIPEGFIESVDKGIGEALTQGVLAGYPIDGVRVHLLDGSYHDVDSTKEAFRIAGSLAAMEAARKAAPMLFEPVMLIEVTVPEEYLADSIANITGRHGLIDSCESRDGTSVILARAPLAGLFGYGTDLRQRTVGRGTFKTRFYRYQPCPVAGGEDEDRDSMVGAPLRPRPNLRVSGAALPEPDDGGRRSGR